MRSIARTARDGRRRSAPLKRGRPPARDRREVRRASMVKAAVRVIKRLGPGATMADIAREAGVSKPILYRQFADKTDLHAEVAASATTALIARLQAALGREARRQRQLKSVIGAYLAYVERERLLVGFLRQAPASIARSPRQPVEQFAATLASHISIVLRDGLEAAGRDPGPAEAWAAALVGYVQAAADWWVVRRAVPHGVVAEQLTWLIWNGLAGLDQGEARVGVRR